MGPFQCPYQLLASTTFLAGAGPLRWCAERCGIGPETVDGVAVQSVVLPDIAVGPGWQLVGGKGLAAGVHATCRRIDQCPMVVVLAEGEHTLRGARVPGGIIISQAVIALPIGARQQRIAAAEGVVELGDDHGGCRLLGRARSFGRWRADGGLGGGRWHGVRSPGAAVACPVQRRAGGQQLIDTPGPVGFELRVIRDHHRAAFVEIDIVPFPGDPQALGVGWRQCRGRGDPVVVQRTGGSGHGLSWQGRQLYVRSRRRAGRCPGRLAVGLADGKRRVVRPVYAQAADSWLTVG